ncbi:MAG: hypothetical protein QM754_14185 [Tepidisphaeraceae bacterium]
MPDFLPRADSELLTFATNLVANITAQPGVFGLPEDLVAEVTRLVQAFDDALLDATRPSTRTALTVCRKDEVRTEMKRVVRRACAIIRTRPNLPSDALVSIRCRPRKTAYQRRGAVPAEAPLIDVIAYQPGSFTVQLSTRTPSMKYRPKGATGALVFKAYGDAPLTLSEWTYVGMPKKRTIAIDYPPDLPIGTRVWVRACWTGHAHDLSRFSEALGVTTGMATVRVA